MERISTALKTFVKYLKDARGVSLYEITAAVAMTGILAAVAVPVIIDKVTEAKSARAVQETDAIYKAMQAFQRDTGRLPGEKENAVLLRSQSTTFPDGPVGGALSSLCATAGTACPDINRYLVGPLSSGDAVNYPNWKGPYIDTIVADPFERTYLVNVQALYKVDTATVSCGFGWVLSAGPNRTLETSFRVNSVDPITSDDLGKNNGKKNAPGTLCTTAAP